MIATTTGRHDDCAKYALPPVARAMSGAGLVRESNTKILLAVFLLGFLLGTLTGWPVSAPFVWTP
jgi:hypothetical protein